MDLAPGVARSGSTRLVEKVPGLWLGCARVPGPEFSVAVAGR